jgi:hypothetical protein
MLFIYLFFVPLILTNLTILLQYVTLPLYIVAVVLSMLGFGKQVYTSHLLRQKYSVYYIFIKSNVALIFDFALWSTHKFSKGGSLK